MSTTGASLSRDTTGHGGARLGESIVIGAGDGAGAEAERKGRHHVPWAGKLGEGTL